MPIPIMKADLESVITPVMVTSYSQGNAGKVTEAIVQAWDALRSACLNWFTPESFDALTTATLPPEAKLYTVWHAIQILAAGNKESDNIKQMAEAAAKFRGLVVADKVRCFDSILTRTSDQADGAGVDFEAGERRFDRSKRDYWRRPRRS